MYWYRSKSIYRLFLGAVLLLCILQACKPDCKGKHGADVKYFDLKGYFKARAARLTKVNKPVLKTVMHNGVTETKKVHIDNWGPN